MDEPVVCVHGLWMAGPDMALLRRRLRRCGFNSLQFRYPTIKQSLQQSARQLNDFVRGIDADKVHFVGHSLGGVLIGRLFLDFPQQPPGRIVTLGTPHLGSHIACAMLRSSFWRPLLGINGPLICEGLPSWEASRELGSIAGELPLGVGQLVRSLPKPNDGTVAVRETRPPGLKDHLTLPVSHTALLFSRAASRATCRFLVNGHF